MKRLFVSLVAIFVVVGAYYAIRLSPILLTDNQGAEKVVLLHGLGRSEASMLLMESALTTAGFDVHSIGYPSTDEAPEALLKLVSLQIDDCCQGKPETVHFVGHSLGGLLIRAYLGQHQPKNLGRVVLLGTPNKGSELAEVGPPGSLQNWALKLAGPTAKALRTGPDGFPARLKSPYYPVGVIAGTQDVSASNKWLPLPNDGMVSVESARLEGMTDFITFDISHWQLRSAPEVIEQVIAFLSNGRFQHATR